MVVGQLPFVSGRKNLQLTSQERRKRLVTQINKGLGAAQKQAISSLSLEFRTMMNKLLTADPAKRITVKELITHAWITERGRKSVQTHPIKKLQGPGQIKVNKSKIDPLKLAFKYPIPFSANETHRRPPANGPEDDDNGNLQESLRQTRRNVQHLNLQTRE